MVAPVFIRSPLIVEAAPSTKRGGLVKVMGHQEVASLSPDDAAPSVHWVMVSQMHNAMVELNEYNVLERVLAESYDVSKDGLRYSFKLRKGVKFHDGSELTADDVKYTFEWYMNPANAANNATRFTSVDKVETPDKSTVVIKMKEPFAPFLIQTASTYIYSAKYHGRVGEKTYKSQPMGTGPFKLREWRPAEYTIVDAFDGHFRGRPEHRPVPPGHRPRGLGPHHRAARGQLRLCHLAAARRRQPGVRGQHELHRVSNIEYGREPLPDQQQAPAAVG